MSTTGQFSIYKQKQAPLPQPESCHPLVSNIITHALYDNVIIGYACVGRELAQQAGHTSPGKTYLKVFL
jgi:hypothetical protein